MKTYKIRNVDKSVCTCEQMVAYNCAWMHSHYLTNEQCVEYIKEYCIEKKLRYNVDAIIIAFKNGIDKYRKKRTIATSHSEVGELFPL